ncbi:MAG: TetR family transcriptional regulator [Deltaproteobacteria bacterium RIFOXYD12_FULL_57_12]|nr:MAG: TetR family transcriptional regulator [Deltaproteobacteria bacterium RIFOXYD12_FULL_57_12]
MKTIDKHEKIIKAAVKVFAKKGFFSARISDIAKVAKVADGTIYLYFNNKFDILLSVFDIEIGRLINQVKELIEKETNPCRMLEIFALKHLSLLKENRSLAEIIQMELRQNNKLIKEYRVTKFSEYVDIISHVIRQGQALNLFRKDIQPGIAKRAFFGALDEMARLWILAPKPAYNIEETAMQISKIFLCGIIDKGSAQADEKRC